MKQLTLFIILLLVISSNAQDFKFPMGISSGEDSAYESAPLKTSLTRQFYTNLQSEASLKKFAPTPRTQGRFGTCTAWAVAYSARTILQAQQQNLTNQTEIDNIAFAPAFTYRMVEPDNKTCWGAYTGSAVNSLVTDGALPLANWKYTGDTFHCPKFVPDSTLMQHAKKYKIEQYTKLFYSESNNKTKTEKVKLSLSNGNPVVISMICPKSFHYVKNDLWEPSENPQLGEHGRHAMTTVAFDDNKYGGAFLIQNSWGSRYGKDGFVWVKYNDYANFVYQAIELIKLPELKKGEPIYKGKLRIFNLEDEKDLAVKVKSKTRQWNTNLGGSNAGANYEVINPVKSGDRVRIYIENNQPAFVYLLSTTSVDNSVNELFPMQNSGLSAALNYSKNEVALPNDSGNFQLDNNVGTDYMIMLFSREKLDANAVRKHLAQSTKSDGEALRSYFGDKIILSKDVQYDANQISFETNYKGDSGKVMALIIKYKHI